MKHYLLSSFTTVSRLRMYDFEMMELATVEIAFFFLFLSHLSLFKGPFWSGAQMCGKLIWSHFGSEGHQSQESERKGTAPNIHCQR